MLPGSARATELSGRVIGRNGQPRPGVQVFLDGPRHYFVLSQGDGAFRIPEFQPGRYAVRVQSGSKVQEFFRTLGPEAFLELRVGW